MVPPCLMLNTLALSDIFSKAKLSAVSIETQGGINFGPGWRIELEMQTSQDFLEHVLAAPSAPSEPKQPM